MSAQACPWLEDLDEDWVQPPIYTNPTIKPDLTSADCDANSLRSNRSRIPRKSSGSYSNSSVILNTDSITSTKKNRNPLGELSSSAGNAVQDASRSVSMASAGSVVRYDTVERRASPGKQQATLEWKKRLVHGQVGYGDQTDLFGANGLENIFAAPTKPSPKPDKPSSRPSRLFKMHDPPPSSPPPWPSVIDFASQSTPTAQDDSRSSNLDQVQEEDAEDDATYEDLDVYAQDQDLPFRCAETQRVDRDDSRQETQDHSGSIRLESSPHHLPVTTNSSIRTAFLASTGASHHGNRTISGQTDFSGEAFSPVYISKHTTLTGQIDYATMDSYTMKQLERVDQVYQESDSSEPTTGDEPQQRPQGPPMNEIESQLLDDLLEDTLPSVPEVSLPDNLPTGTPPIATLGNFVNLKRGGLSAYGSFKNRPLSPSQSETLRSRLSAVQQSHQASEMNGSVLHNTEQPSAQRTDSIHRPGTPDKDESSLLSPPKPRSSASPLKLFGNYDTFTNNRLLRRLSQLEDFDQENSQASITKNDGDNHSNQALEDPFEEGVSSPTLAPGSSTQRNENRKQRVVSSLSSFGEGELNDHDFEADLSFPSGLNLDEPADYMSEGSPPPGLAPPGSKTPFRFHLEESSPDTRQMDNLKRKLSKRSTARSRPSAQYGTIDRHAIPSNHKEEVSQYTEGKRPRSSPSKAPTPKRRRTLVALHGELPGMGHGSEIDVKITRTEYVSRREMVEEEYPATTKRNVTRPRNPTPSQRSRDDVQAEVEEATLNFLSSSPRLEAIKENLELGEIPINSLDAEQAKAVAAEVAAFTLNISKAEADGKRTRSITTQDFLDEAMHIMALIRAKGRPHSGLGSVEESDVEDVYGSHLRPEDIERSPSPLRVSRPPSREGASTGWRPRSQMQHDPRIVSQLRKFQESDDIDLLETSIKSLHVEEPGEHHFSDEAIIAEGLANIRINGPRQEVNRDRGESDASRNGKLGSPTKTHTSHPSVDSSAGGRTIGTNSTRKSDNVATLAPETVAHLIPEEVAGMTFDREKKRWIRIKGSRRRSRDTPNPPSNVTSDDDPFNEIPDLTVDEVKELTRVQGLLTRSQQSFFDQSQVILQDNQEEESRAVSAETVLTRPITRDNAIAPTFASSSAHSKYSGFASSRTQVETRATSWSNEELAAMARSKQHHAQTATMSPAVSDIAEDVDEESFSSQDDSLPLDDSVTEELPLPAPKQRQHQPFVQSSPGLVYRPVPRQFSLRRQTLNRGFYGQDQSEMSFIAQLPDKRLMSLSVSVSRPPSKVSVPSQELAVPSSSPARVDATFYLSDLPEFTLHDVDPEQSSEKLLAKRVAQPVPSDRFNMAMQNLVKTLTDVEPDEPYWEDIKQLSLRERKLGSVHNLEDFCTRLEDLDLSNNNVTHLEGAPNSIRRLNVRSNALSSLTAWGHLTNLQYLDISNNSIDSLGGLGMLYHLRELKADNNQITSLDGVMGLDGLLKLSVRRNKLASVDFGSCQLNRLEELDLGNNQLVSISSTNGLSSLARLTVDTNELHSFGLADGACPKLTTLSLQKNHLSGLNISHSPNLQYLNVDSNQLATINGLEHLRHLDILSMRKQTVPVTILSSHLHARSIYLSANIIADLSLPHAHHSVQTFELASCGLEYLPEDFGLKLPNLRDLNISFNAIDDIRPLLNIANLETLHVAGNRIARLRKTVAVLGRLNGLQRCDLRENPLTLGLYPPLLPNAQSRDLVSTSLAEAQEEAAVAEMEEVKLQKKIAASYTLPAADMGSDMDALKRIDEETRLRRKIYELLVVTGCRKLIELDGLALDRGRVLVRDWAWERLVELGIVKKSDRTVSSIAKD